MYIGNGRKGHHVSGSEFDVNQLSEYKGVKLKAVWTLQFNLSLDTPVFVSFIFCRGAHGRPIVYALLITPTELCPQRFVDEEKIDPRLYQIGEKVKKMDPRKRDKVFQAVEALVNGFLEMP